jgi:hypothetical protein
MMNNNDTIRTTTATTMPSSTTTRRFIERNLAFHQSKNVMNVRAFGRDYWEMVMLLKEDWFHFTLRRHTLLSVTVILSVWTISVGIFAGLYQFIDNYYEFQDCGLSSSFGKLTYGGFFAFSLETCTSVGYGLPGSTQAFFKNCPAIQVAIYVHMVYSMLFNAFIFAFFYARLARANRRGVQVIMSNTCCIRLVDEEGGNNNNNKKWVLEVRVFDTDARHPIVESHVRLYVRTKMNEQLIPLRIISPTDETDAMIFLGLPCRVRHEIDVYSPLHPQHHHHGGEGDCCPTFRLPNNSGLHLRDVDSRTGNIEQFVCPICSETYGDLNRLRAHVKYNQLIESHDQVPVEMSHQSLSLLTPSLLEKPLPPPTLADMKASFPEEVLVVVEGIDPLTSGTFQGLQSYTMDDVSWDASFVNCVMTREEQQSSAITVNLRLFHAVTMMNSNNNSS